MDSPDGRNITQLKAVFGRFVNVTRIDRLRTESEEIVMDPRPIRTDLEFV